MDTWHCLLVTVLSYNRINVLYIHNDGATNTNIQEHSEITTYQHSAEEIEIIRTLCRCHHCTCCSINTWKHKQGSCLVKKSLDRLSLIHISEPTRLLSISYAVFCLKKKHDLSSLAKNSNLYGGRYLVFSKKKLFEEQDNRFSVNRLTTKRYALQKNSDFCQTWQLKG